MPELPDIDAYLAALDKRIVGRRLTSATVFNPFFLRSVDPPLQEAVDRKVVALSRVGKRIAIGLDTDDWLVLHPMIAGRLHWSDDPPRPARPNRNVLARFGFESGTLTVTEAGTKKRASLYFVRGSEALASHDPGGLDVLDADFGSFEASLRRENRTLKRALTDPRILSGIGNAYSDEILHRARLSPVTLTSRLGDSAMQSLFESTRAVLTEWRDRLIAEAGRAFPKKVTAFRPEMAVHGKFGKPCPVCDTPVQRIRYASNETNYCPRCQTGGKILADRSLSKLLKRDWPKSIEELEERQSSPFQSRGPVETDGN